VGGYPAVQQPKQRAKTNWVAFLLLIPMAHGSILCPENCYPDVSHDFHQSFQPNARPAPHLGHIQSLFSNCPTELLAALLNKPEVNKYKDEASTKSRP